MCAVCLKPVDSILVWRDEAMCQENYVVKCHGRVQKFSVREEDLLGAERITVGMAFQGEPQLQTGQG